jgi:hypothetical protein
MLVQPSEAVRAEARGAMEREGQCRLCFVRGILLQSQVGLQVGLVRLFRLLLLLRLLLGGHDVLLKGFEALLERSVLGPIAHHLLLEGLKSQFLLKRGIPVFRLRPHLPYDINVVLAQSVGRGQQLRWASQLRCSSWRRRLLLLLLLLREV